MFKKTLGLMMAAIMVFALAACGQTSAQNSDNQTASDSVVSNEALKTQSSETETPTSAEGEETESDGKTLVVYFSWSGNTEEMASYIAEQTDGDLLEIEPKVAYPADYNETGDIAKVERDENARPEIANLPASIDEYDTILVGYPIWWHTAPMIIGTFLENYDLTGKEVYPFTQSASMDTEQFDQSIEFVREVSEGATVHDGMFARPSDTDAIDTYLSDNGLVNPVPENQPADTSESADTASDSTDEDTNALVVYFSVPDDRDNSYVEVDGERLGNTQYMAQVIGENTGADIFRIQPITPYPTDHEELLEAAQNEIRTNARPEINGTIENFDSYDVVFVGYPNWNADMPYIMYSFFESYDFSGKTIVPFMTHGGSGFSGTQGTIAELEPDATMLEGKAISRSSIEDAGQEIIDWIDELGLLKKD